MYMCISSFLRVVRVWNCFCFIWLCLLITDAAVRMTDAMVSASETNGMTSTVDVCVDPDVDAIELPLTVTLTATDGKAGEFPALM